MVIKVLLSQILKNKKVTKLQKFELKKINMFTNLKNPLLNEPQRKLRKKKNFKKNKKRIWQKK